MNETMIVGTLQAAEPLKGSIVSSQGLTGAVSTSSAISGSVSADAHLSGDVNPTGVVGGNLSAAYGTPGRDGKDGYTPVKGVDYFDGLPGNDGLDGQPGKDGYTPQKGIDYFDGEPGKDGYTPIKGVDYFDGLPGDPGKDGQPGKDGYTPVKGVDYFDGQPGADGYTPQRGKDYWTTEDVQSIVAQTVTKVKTELSGVVLFQGGINATTGKVESTQDAITLSDSAANYGAFDIYYVSNDTHWSHTKVIDPNGKDVMLLGALVGNTDVFMKLKCIRINGKTVSIASGTDSTKFFAGEGALIGGTLTRDKKFIVITKIVGYPK